MRTVIQGKKVILVGDTTTTGGKVLSGSSLANQSQALARKGDPVFCPACKATGVISEGSTLANIAGIEIALEGHKVSCGCPNGCTLVASA
ncbi:putative Zn-binding protein involved in type VI secretion [Serratia fonticola]|uniref:Putative Zn-binding protein involved in type VI secretion n=1 Tax=Serratia fonticola TaxID=47917 RepID=A0A559SGU8_SERFO|nr:PAAR domain-containing protein [Serratia fonticola]TQI77343.1 putative Zn-binding protein involved in type VI secretion [Serratia fonticola]TQI93614.1 putative Zn-binding protein involved in type VI secretion [Serratia fonticola]TVZ61563.1 putative Zn-binding protein involved in type VI secretion [Serratia fonticola]